MLGAHTEKLFGTFIYFTPFLPQSRDPSYLGDRKIKRQLLNPLTVRKMGERVNSQDAGESDFLECHA